jgi:DNA-binding GntR family transcriptional regulator
VVTAVRAGNRTQQKPRPLKEQAYERLKAMILDETFPPGGFLSERQLSEVLGMSKTPIRAALERLESERLVTTSPQQGVVVREISLQEVADLFEVRIVLEEYVVRKIAGRLTLDQTRCLEANLAAQAAAVEHGDVDMSARLDTGLHLMLCDYLGNQEITRIMAGFRDKLHRLIVHILRRDTGRPLNSYGEHRAIVEAIVSGTADLAAARMTAHLEWGRRFMSPAR